jgi:hypothetical protein
MAAVADFPDMQVRRAFDRGKDIPKTLSNYVKRALSRDQYALAVTICGTRDAGKEIILQAICRCSNFFQGFSEEALATINRLSSPGSVVVPKRTATNLSDSSLYEIFAHEEHHRALLGLSSAQRVTLEKLIPSILTLFGGNAKERRELSSLFQNVFQGESEELLVRGFAHEFEIPQNLESPAMVFAEGKALPNSTAIARGCLEFGRKKWSIMRGAEAKKLLELLDVAAHYRNLAETEAKKDIQCLSRIPKRAMNCIE